MQYEVNSGSMNVVFETVDLNVIVGDAARIDVGAAINYIKTGQAEVQEVVDNGIEAFNLNATQKTTAFNNNATVKTTDFNDNAINKTTTFNNNATSKTGDFNTNATNKTNAFNQNASDKTDAFDLNASNKTTAFNNNATAKTTAFDNNATDKTNAFNLNATNKTTDFNDNYTAKKALIDAEVGNAAASATAADNSAKEAKQWAIGDPSEPSGNSAKYWADEAATTLANKQDKLVSGTNIKTINNESLLGSGNISISGGASYTAGTGIDITSDVISVDSTVVTTNTDQDITGIKTFVGEKRIKFKQSASGNKLGFTLYDNTGKEAAAFEYRPNAINSYPLMYLGQYKGSSSVSYVSTPIYVGFRYYDSYNNASYNLVAPLAKDARSSFSLDLNYKTFYLPLGVTDGNTTVTTGSNGVLDISSLLSGGGGSYTAGTGIDITSNTISVDSTVVTTNTAQTITGTKTFEGYGWTIYLKNNYVYYNVAPSEDIGTTIIYTDANNNAMGAVECWRTTDNATIMQFNAHGANGSWGSYPLQFRVDANGNSYAHAPTPAAGSNGTNIATTGWVHTEAPNLVMPNYAASTALTLPASGGTMQAPKDGYLCIVIDVQEGSYLSIGSNYYQSGIVSGYIGGIYPIKKNDTVYIFYSNLLNTIDCRFIPCVGAV